MSSKLDLRSCFQSFVVSGVVQLLHTAVSIPHMTLE